MQVIKEDFALLKDNLDIIDVLRVYLQDLKPTGSTHTALCPFHPEKTPSFKVWPKSGTYQCQGCKASGDIITFVQEMEKLPTASDAALFLAKRYEIPVRTVAEKDVSIHDEDGEIILANEFALKSFQEQFYKSYQARKYMVERGYTKQLVEKWEIGYASYDYFLDYNEASLKKAGLIVEKNNVWSNKFKGRIIFPIRDKVGRLIGFGGRLLEESNLAPKYLNTDENLVYKKREILYGYYNAQKLIKKLGYGIIVEGYTDVNLVDRADYRNTVGICGTSFTDEQAQLICSHGGKFNIYMIDNDTAGRKSAFNVIIKHWKNNMYCVVVCPKQEGYDPAKAAVEYGVDMHEQMEELCQIKILYEYAKGEREDKTEEVLSYIAMLPSALKRHEMIEILAGVSNFPIKVLSEQINKHLQKVFYVK